MKASSVTQSISPECAAKEVRKAADMDKITAADRALADVLEVQQALCAVAVEAMASKCPACHGKSVGRDLQTCEAGSDNAYPILLCTACGHYQGRAGEYDHLLIAGVEVYPLAIGQRLEFIFDPADLILDLCIQARTELALIDFVVPGEANEHPQGEECDGAYQHRSAAFAIARRCGALCDRLGRDIPPMLAKVEYLARAWEVGALYPLSRTL